MKCYSACPIKQVFLVQISFKSSEIHVLNMFEFHAKILIIQSVSFFLNPELDYCWAEFRTKSQPLEFLLNFPCSSLFSHFNIFFSCWMIGRSVERSPQIIWLNSCPHLRGGQIKLKSTRKKRKRSKLVQSCDHNFLLLNLVNHWLLFFSLSSSCDVSLLRQNLKTTEWLPSLLFSCPFKTSPFLSLLKDHKCVLLYVL